PTSAIPCVRRTAAKPIPTATWSDTDGLAGAAPPRARTFDGVRGRDRCPGPVPGLLPCRRGRRRPALVDRACGGAGGNRGRPVARRTRLALHPLAPGRGRLHPAPRAPVAARDAGAAVARAAPGPAPRPAAAP